MPNKLTHVYYRRYVVDLVRKSNQELVLIMNGENRYGLFNSPCNKDFMRMCYGETHDLEQNIKNHFNEGASHKELRDIPDDFNSLLIFLEKTKAGEFISNDLVTKALSSINL